MAGRPFALLVVLVAVFAPSAFASGVPTHQTFEPAGLRVTFELPADWGADLPADANWSWQAKAPGLIAHMYLAAVKTSIPFSRIGPNFVAVLRNQALKADAHATITSGTTHIASFPAVEVMTRVHGVNQYGPQVFVDYSYAFEHGGMLYIVNYTTTAKFLGKEKAAFDDSIKSLRFPDVA